MPVCMPPTLDFNSPMALRKSDVARAWARSASSSLCGAMRSRSCGRYGTTLDYARQTFDGLRAHGIHDRALGRLLRLADPGAPPA